MYNDYYLLKRIEDKEGELSFASAMDSFTYQGEVVQSPYLAGIEQNIGGRWIEVPQIGDKVIFLKGSGEDVGEHKAVKLEDILMKI
jgi:hypothetical protein